MAPPIGAELTKKVTSLIVVVALEVDATAPPEPSAKLLLKDVPPLRFKVPLLKMAPPWPEPELATTFESNMQSSTLSVPALNAPPPLVDFPPLTASPLARDRVAPLAISKTR